MVLYPVIPAGGDAGTEGLSPAKAAQRLQDQSGIFSENLSQTKTTRELKGKSREPKFTPFLNLRSSCSFQSLYLNLFQ